LELFLVFNTVQPVYSSRGGGHNGIDVGGSDEMDIACVHSIDGKWGGSGFPTNQVNELFGYSQHQGDEAKARVRAVANKCSLFTIVSIFLVRKRDNGAVDHLFWRSERLT
jgi:hypothetical protein